MEQCFDSTFKLMDYIDNNYMNIYNLDDNFFE